MRADARANRLAILEAAAALYATRGVEVPMSAVAQAAGVGIATLYRHFPTPVDLLFGVGEHMLEQVADVCESSLPLLRADPERGWRAFIDGILALRIGALAPQVVPFFDRPEVGQRFAELRSRLERSLHPVLNEAKSAGLLRPEIGVLQFHVGLGAITRPLPAAADVHVPGQMQWLVEVFLRGIRP